MRFDQKTIRIEIGWEKVKINRTWQVWGCSTVVFLRRKLHSKMGDKDHGDVCLFLWRFHESMNPFLSCLRWLWESRGKRLLKRDHHLVSCISRHLDSARLTILKTLTQSTGFVVKKDSTFALIFFFVFFGKTSNLWRNHSLPGDILRQESLSFLRSLTLFFPWGQGYTWRRQPNVLLIRLRVSDGTSSCCCIFISLAFSCLLTSFE